MRGYHKVTDPVGQMTIDKDKTVVAAAAAKSEKPHLPVTGPPTPVFAIFRFSAEQVIVLLDEIACSRGRGLHARRL
jgi:hypothetical protein